MFFGFICSAEIFRTHSHGDSHTHTGETNYHVSICICKHCSSVQVSHGAVEPIAADDVPCSLACFSGIWHLLQMADTVCATLETHTPPPPCTATFRFHRPPATPPRTYTPKMASFPHLTRFTNQRKFLKNVSTHTHTQKKVNTKNRFRALTVQNLDRLIPCKVSYCNVANMFLCLKRFVAIIDFLLQF